MPLYRPIFPNPAIPGVIAVHCLSVTSILISSAVPIVGQYQYISNSVSFSILCSSLLPSIQEVLGSIRVANNPSTFCAFTQY